MDTTTVHAGEVKMEREAGVCVPWNEKKEEMGEIVGEEKLVKESWEGVDGLGYTFIWQMLVSF